MLSPSVRDFILYADANGSLIFDPTCQLKAKSGRLLPWFFNAGNLMQHAEWLTKLAKIYVHALRENFSKADGSLDADILYGPAYKGIPLAAVVATEYYNQTGKNIGFSSHRKEVKDHGEWGNGFGMKVAGKKCIILDDVITAGTAFRLSVDEIEKDGGSVSGLVVLIDRQEVTGGIEPPAAWEKRISAVMAAREENGIQVVWAFTYAEIREAVREWLIGNTEIGDAMDKNALKYGI